MDSEGETRMDEEGVGKFLTDNPDFLKDWILKNADQKIIEELSDAIQVSDVISKPFGFTIRYKSTLAVTGKMSRKREYVFSGKIGKNRIFT